MAAGNAVQWLLAKADKRLAEVEGRPIGKGPAKAWVDASQSPAGLQAGKVLGATFKLSGLLAGVALQVSFFKACHIVPSKPPYSVMPTRQKCYCHVLQGAVPIGKWAAKQGLGISLALLRGSSNKKRKR